MHNNPLAKHPRCVATAPDVITLYCAQREPVPEHCVNSPASPPSTLGLAHALSAGGNVISHCMLMLQVTGCRRGQVLSAVTWRPLPGAAKSQSSPGPGAGCSGVSWNCA